MSQSGIGMRYKRKNYNLTPLESAIILKHLNFIEDYWLTDTNVHIFTLVTEDAVHPDGEFETVIFGNQSLMWDFFYRNYDIPDYWIEGIAEALDKGILALIR